MLRLQAQHSTTRPGKQGEPMYSNYEYVYMSFSLDNGARESGPYAAKYCTLGANWTSAI